MAFVQICTTLCFISHHILNHWGYILLNNYQSQSITYLLYYQTVTFLSVVWVLGLHTNKQQYTLICNDQPFQPDGHTCRLPPSQTQPCFLFPISTTKQRHSSPHLSILVVNKDIPRAIVLQIGHLQTVSSANFSWLESGVDGTDLHYGFGLSGLQEGDIFFKKVNGKVLSPYVLKLLFNKRKVHGK